MQHGLTVYQLLEQISHLTISYHCHSIYFPNCDLWKIHDLLNVDVLGKMIALGCGDAWVESVRINSFGKDSVGPDISFVTFCFIVENDRTVWNCKNWRLTICSWQIKYNLQLTAVNFWNYKIMSDIISHDISFLSFISLRHKGYLVRKIQIHLSCLIRNELYRLHTHRQKTIP